MIGLRSIFVTFLCTAVLWDVAVCRPASRLDDFMIDDDISLSDDGSGSGKTVELGSYTKGIQLVGSGDDDDSEESGSASGDGDSEEELGIDFVSNISISESTKSRTLITTPTTEVRNTETLTARKEDTVTEIGLTMAPEDRGSGHPPLLVTEAPVIYTSSKDGDNLKDSLDGLASGSASGSGSGLGVTDSGLDSSSSSGQGVTDSGIGLDSGSSEGVTDSGIGLGSGSEHGVTDSELGSGSGSGQGVIDSDAEENIVDSDSDDDIDGGEEFITTTSTTAKITAPAELPATTISLTAEEEDEEGSTDQTDFSIDTISFNLTAESGSGVFLEVEPPRLSGFPAPRNLSTDIDILDEFLPVTSRKSTAYQSPSTTTSTTTTTSGKTTHQSPSTTTSSTTTTTTTTTTTGKTTHQSPSTTTSTTTTTTGKTTYQSPSTTTTTTETTGKTTYQSPSTTTTTTQTTGKTTGKTTTTSTSSPPTSVHVKVETLPPPVIELTLGHGMEEESTVHTTLDDSTLVTSPENNKHSGKIDGRRRKPIHSDTTDVTDLDVSVGAISEDDGDKDEKKVSYFAVIAAALIAAIVFFILGYVTRKLKNRRGALPLPWNKDKMKLEASVDTGNGSAAQVYRDTSPDKYTPVHLDEEECLKDLAEVHPNPKDVNISDTNAASQAIPMSELSPHNTDDQQPASVEATETRIDELKYMDETDEELESAATSPLLEGEDTTGAERGDLASQVLNTVDKNLNAISESDSLLPSSTDMKTSNGLDTAGETSTR